MTQTTSIPSYMRNGQGPAAAARDDVVTRSSILHVSLLLGPSGGSLPSGIIVHHLLMRAFAVHTQDCMMDYSTV